MKAWVHDLQTIGYRFPEIKNQSLTQPLTVVPSDHANVLTVPVWTRHYDIVLIIGIKTPYTGFLLSVNVLHKAYLPLFKQVVFTGFQRPQGLPDHIRWVECSSQGGAFMYSCLANAMDDTVVAPTGGYLFLAENALFSHSQIPSFNRSHIWFHTDVKIVHNNIKTGTIGEEQVTGGSQSSLNVQRGKDKSVGQSFIDVLSSLMPSGKHVHRLGEAVARHLGHPEQKHFQEERAEAFYIPGRLATDFLLGAVLFREADVHHDLAVSTLLGLLSDRPIQTFKAKYWDHKRDGQPTGWLLLNGQLQDNTFVLQPYNMSTPEALEGFQGWWYNRSTSQ